MAARLPCFSEDGNNLNKAWNGKMASGNWHQLYNQLIC